MIFGFGFAIPLIALVYVVAIGTPTGNGTLDFSTANDSGLLVLLEDF